MASGNSHEEYDLEVLNNADGWICDVSHVLIACRLNVQPDTSYIKKLTLKIGY